LAEKTFVSDIKEGQEISGAYLLVALRQRLTKNGKPYLKITLADKTGEIDGVIWEEALEKNPGAQNLKEGDILKIVANSNLSRYSNQIELSVSQIIKLPCEKFDIRQFLPSTDKDIDQLAKELHALIDQISNIHLKKLMDMLFSNQDFSDAFKAAPAAKHYHHAYLGGLLEHSVNVAKLAIEFSSLYPVLDKSLLIAGAILHDVGKIQELNYLKKIDYSTRGRLFGHIVIGNQIVTEAIKEIDDFPQELKTHLSHLILSHQGELEYGAAVKPQTKEAIVLNIIDNADAKINGFMQIAKRYGDKTEWSDYQSMFETYLYLGKPLKESIPSQPPLIDDDLS
jgi:3'-5' exoribonuclease